MPTETKKFELPRSIVNQSQFTLRVSSEDRRRKILKLMEVAGTKQLSTALWKAIDAYIGESEVEE
jgi:hypothetical protein